MSVFIFLVVLCVLILVHEWGHFITAKKLGMRVEEFSIGFPPRLIAKKVGETLYSFNLFLIGGYVKILGEDPTADGHASDPRSFSAKPRWAQAVVLLAGVTMNVLLAWALFFVVFMIGTQSAVEEADRSEHAVLTVTVVLPESPAAEGGIRAGAQVLEVESEGEKLLDETPSAFQAFVHEHQNDDITITYTYKGEQKIATVSPETGLIAEAPNQRAVGLALAFIETTSYPPLQAAREATVMTAVGLKDITVGITGLLWDAIRFDADLADVAGPIGIVGLVGEASAFGLTTLLMFTAFISLNLAVINILPFPALDGGRLLFVLIEEIKGSPIKPAFANTLNTIGFLLLIFLMLAVTYNDISKLL